MLGKFSHPYQRLLLRLLHALTSLSAIAAILTAFWTYDVYDGRWGNINLPKFTEIEGIHGTFGLWTLLIFPLLAIYAFNRGQQKLIQSNSWAKLGQVGIPIWWYTLHRLVNTMVILAITFAVFSGKMMSEKWLPQGELNHFWYYAHLIAWLILVIAIALHILMSLKVGGISLILSMFNWRYRSQDSPRLWSKHLDNWRENLRMSLIRKWRSPWSFLKLLEFFILTMIVLAWLISLIKEFG
jgi:hypothetical protein